MHANNSRAKTQLVEQWTGNPIFTQTFDFDRSVIPNFVIGKSIELVFLDRENIAKFSLQPD